MVTAAQVKVYLKPLIDENDDLALVGRLLVVTPVKHILRGVLIDRRSSAEAIVPVWFCYHLFGPYPDYFLSWGDQLYGRNWRTDDPGISEALCAEISKLALPKLREVNSLEVFVAAMAHTRGGHLLSKSPDYRTLFDLAMGDLESARVLCRDKICLQVDPGPQEADVTIARSAGAKRLCALLEKDDVPGLIRTLHDWEARNVKALKLAPYWEPTPFPIEENWPAK